MRSFIPIVAVVSMYFLQVAAEEQQLTRDNFWITETQQLQLQKSHNPKFIRGGRRLDIDDDALEACHEEMAAIQQQNQAFGTVCECQLISEGVRLVCVDECAYCNDDITTCGIRSVQALFEEGGDRVAMGATFQYTRGMESQVVVQESECFQEEAPGGYVKDTCTQCDVLVGDVFCNSCVIHDCGEGTSAELMNCENIEKGAIYDFCKEDEISVKEGNFQIFSGNEFRQCLPTSHLRSSNPGVRGT